MAENLVFFSRCRPQKADIADLAIRERRIFIGYPAWIQKAARSRTRLRKCIVDLACTDEEWKVQYRKFDKARRHHYQKNRNLVSSVHPGAIALIPRPSGGVVHASHIKRPFELLDNPPWAKKYLDLRRLEGLEIEDEFSHLGDIAQSWAVDKYVPIPFPLIPAWIRRSFFGRSTYGRVSSLVEIDRDPYPILERLMKESTRPTLKWTTDLGEVEERLLDGVGPNSFEHLCVHLLQLEDPRNIWIHVGGSGDGGVDGEGASPNGGVIGLLQCKWCYTGEKIGLVEGIKKGRKRLVVAALIHGKVLPKSKNFEFWSRRKIATLVIKHHRSLPLAASLRIGRNKS